MNKNVIQIGSKIFSFPRLKYETDYSYFIRSNYFIKVSPKTNKEYLNAINMSIVCANIQILNCTYKKETIEYMNKLLNYSVK